MHRSFVMKTREHLGVTVKTVTHHAIVVGSGAAGFNAINRLHDYHVHDIALVTEGIHMGTSRNTGSDKQTYYKLSLGADSLDGIGAMADSLFKGGLMDGDHALNEAASSARSFFNLVELGVPFPHNAFGEYVGYMTDHDLTNRASSMGPKTSQAMVEALSSKTSRLGIKIYDKLQLVDLIIQNNEIKGILCFDKSHNDHVTYYVIYANQVVLATGGPATLYEASVYPKSQYGALGICLHRGVKAKNLTEFQYGIASIDFRWNLSGSYQQVLPNYVSFDASMQDARYFLHDQFSSKASLLDAIFKKGYQWPFDVAKVLNEGSSLIDLLVIKEKQEGRRVFLDFQSNPVEDYLSHASLEVRNYLTNSNALGALPIDRLRILNPKAILLFKENHIDLSKDLLEIDVCAQHLNGGLSVNGHYETNIKNLYAIGEIAATHGIYRPGGSALNAGQVAGLHVAGHIAGCPSKAIEEVISEPLINEHIAILKTIKENVFNPTTLKQNMSRYAGVLRDADAITDLLKRVQEATRELNAHGPNERMIDFYRKRDLLYTAEGVLFAMQDYNRMTKTSRGGFIINVNEGKNAVPFLDIAFTLENALIDVQEIIKEQNAYYAIMRPIREVPCRETWFENVWKSYNQRFKL